MSELRNERQVATWIFFVWFLIKLCKLYFFLGLAILYGSFFCNLEKSKRSLRSQSVKKIIKKKWMSLFFMSTIWFRFPGWRPWISGMPSTGKDSWDVHQHQSMQPKFAVHTGFGKTQNEIEEKRRNIFLGEKKSSFVFFLHCFGFISFSLFACCWCVGFGPLSGFGFFSQLYVSCSIK